MTARRVAPGPQLATGRLRVDAARAIAKLREYQLAVRAAWVLEAIRAAVASGATRISLDGDTNDLWLSWDGAPWPIADLPRLFDELVGPEASDARYPVRLLAAAVNSALGMDPAYVDVFAIAPTGHATRARYTPDVLDEPGAELGDAPLRRIAVEPAAPPPGAGPGMAIHLRRRFGLTVISHLIRELPELELARAACADLEVPLLVRGVELGRGAPARDVVRVPLGEGLRGFLAIVDPAGAPAHATLEVAERGVVLAASALELGFPERGRPVPVRVFVDGPRMPTNASRSEVRHDLAPISTAIRRARALLPVAAARLAAALEDPELAGGDPPPRARAAALALLAATGRHAAAELGLLRLYHLPLARNAVGAPRPLSAGWRRLVHTGASPFPEELAPWMGDVLWIPPGDPSACLVDPDDLDAEAMKEHARWARREQRARRRFYGHAPRPATVLVREPPRLRARLGARAAGSAVEPRRFDDLSGEVCIAARGRGGVLVLLLEGRELERVTYESPIPFAAVIESRRLVPADRYRGAERDAEYARVEAAMRGGVLCALEALAAGDAGDGFAHAPAPAADGDDGGDDHGDGAGDGGDDAGDGPPPVPAADRRRLLDGLTLALELARGGGVQLAGPLFEAPLWRIAGGGGWATTAALRAQGVLGTVAPASPLRPLPRRLVVEVEPRDQALLAALLPGTTRVVPYDAGLVEPEPLYPIELASALLEDVGVALAVRGERCAGAIAPARVPRVVISHLGRLVEELPYRPALIPCEIHVDGDDVVPDADWRVVLDDGGAARHFAAWELELVRAAAAAITGERSPELLGAAIAGEHSPIAPHGALGRALWIALASRDPAALLGDPLADRLRARPLLRVLGEREPVSARDLAARHPQEIPYLDAAAAPIAGFAPLLADPVLARAVGRLAGRAMRDAAPELAAHLRAAEREARLAALRARPALPLELPGGEPCVRRETPGLRAVVGVGRGAAMELDVRAEGRPFAAITRAGEPPLAAIVDVPLESLDERLAALRPELEDAIVREVRAAAPELLCAIAAARPAAIADLGPARALLAAALAAPAFDPPSRAVLRAAGAFPTVQGARVSIEQAARRGVIATARRDGAWLGPDAGELPTELDRPVLLVPDDDSELARVIAGLHRGAVADVTEAVARLQGQRRIRRGLLPLPAVHGVAPELKRRLAELGPAGAVLGVGEAGLVDDPGSAALLHVHGELRARVSLDVLPPVLLAIEAPELVAAPDRAPEALRLPAQVIARALVGAVLAELPSLPVWLRHRLRRALLASRVTSELAGVPLFETAAGPWIGRDALAQQVGLFGDVWCVPRPVAGAAPLDPRRVVVALGEDEQALARQAGLPCTDATRYLALDAAARANLARPRPAQLALDPSIRALATVVLDGDGRAAPRGVVAILAPGASAHRGLLAHRELYPFDPADDECLWPTRAIVEDARLAPDRTWSRAERDETWDALVTAIRGASEQALRELARPPPRALASLYVGHSIHAGLDALRGDPATQIRGALWLDGAPGTPGRVDLVHAGGAAAHVAPHGIPLRGALYLTTSYDEPRLHEAIEELGARAHARLLRALVDRRGQPDLIAAHVAHGLALGRISPPDAPGIQLACFRPRPIDARAWEALCRSTARVPLVAPDARCGELSVTDDGTATAAVVLGVLGARAVRDRALPPIPAAPPERFAPPLSDAPDARPAHALDPLVAAVGARLHRVGLAPTAFAILDGEIAPLASHRDGAIAFAGDHPRLRAIAAALLARTAWSAAAVDALVAHVVTVLNVALTSVTDATEAHALGRLLRDA